MVSLLKRIGGALRDDAVQMFGLQVIFSPGTGESKKAAVMDFLKNAVGTGELALGRDIVDEVELRGRARQGCGGVLRALKATNL